MSEPPSTYPHSIMADNGEFLFIMSLPTPSDSVLDNCKPQALYMLRGCNTFMKHTVDSYVSRIFDINTFLSRFFSNPKAFRTLQAFTDTVIAGSTAVQFFAREVYKSTDLDLITSREGVYALCSWIVKEGGPGYVFVPKGEQPLDIATAVLQLPSTRRFVERHPDPSKILGYFKFEVPKSHLRVQVFVAAHSVMDCVLGHHSCEQPF